MKAGAKNPLWLRILLPLVALYALIGYLLLPWALMRVVPDSVASALDARLEMGDIHFDPFRFRLVIFDPRLVGPVGNEVFATEDVLNADRIEGRLLLRSLWQFSPVVALEIDAPRLYVEREAGGSINLTALTRPAEPPESSSTSPKLGLQRLLISGGQLTLLDRSRPEAFQSSAENIEVDLRELWLPAREPAPLWAALGIEGASVDLRGEVTATPTWDLQMTVVNLPLELAERWLAGAGPVERLRGSVHGSGRLTMQNDGLPRLAAGDLHLHGLDLSLPEHLALAGTDFEARLRELRIDAVNGSLWPLDLDVGQLRLEQGHVGIRYGRAETVEAAERVDQAADSGYQTSAAEGPALALRLRALEVVDIDFAVTDATLPMPARFDVGLRRFGAEGLHWPAVPDQPAGVAAEVALAPNGRGEFSGRLDLANSRLQGRLESSRLPLPAIAPWVHAYTRLRLNDGAISQQADLDLSWGAQPVDLRVLLDGRIEGLSIADPDGIDLIAWNSLDLRGLELDLAQRRLALVEIALSEPSLRFARLADGRTNLTGIGPVTAADSEVSEEAPSPATQEAAWQWELSRFTVDAGTLDFIDETLVIPFATRVEALSGSVDDLTSSADSRAELRLDGRIPPTGSARIEARGLPTAPFADTELALRFSGVPMPRMTPWTGTFAGYRVAGGRLDLDLSYRIDQGALGANNKVTVNAMRLGEQIDSPRAMDLPLRLALALLRDSDDNIILEVPVSGNVDDPQFDLRPAIMRAIRNALGNIVAAPFRLLASLVGGGSEEDIDRVLYDLGNAGLDDDQEEQLLTLERALGQRPALGLRLPAVHAGEADRSVLRAHALERELAERSDDRNAALLSLFRERHGEEELEALEAVHRQADPATEHSPEAADSDADDEWTRGGTLLIEIENRLLGGISVGDAELHALARSRAETVYLYLTDAGLDAHRIRIEAEASEVEIAGEQVPLSFELDALDP